MNKVVREVVDRLLMEQGEYLPLEFLLAEGRLDFSEYESWRSGEIPRLEQVLFGDQAQLAEHLREAEVYAKALGLEPEPLNYQGWGSASGTRLSFSDKRSSEDRFHTAYRRPARQPQMDLFIDAAANRLVDDLSKRCRFSSSRRSVQDRNIGCRQRKSNGVLLRRIQV